jgi:hypothetical protein
MSNIQYLKSIMCLFQQSYVDSDWVSSEECKSTNRMVHLLNESVIAWSSKKQTTIALSTGKTEYIFASECTREIVYLRQLLSELGYLQHALTRIHEDNQTCISFTRDDAMHSHTKHINMKYHFT